MAQHQEIARLRRELAQKEEELEILGKGLAFFRSPQGAVEIYCYIQAEKAKYPHRKISVMCRVLGVSKSGYYGWLKRLQAPLRGRAAEDLTLLQEDSSRFMRRFSTTVRLGFIENS